MISCEPGRCGTGGSLVEGGHSTPSTTVSIEQRGGHYSLLVGRRISLRILRSWGKQLGPLVELKTLSSNGLHWTAVLGGCPDPRACRMESLLFLITPLGSILLFD